MDHSVRDSFQSYISESELETNLFVTRYPFFVNRPWTALYILPSQWQYPLSQLISIHLAISLAWSVIAGWYRTPGNSSIDSMAATREESFFIYLKSASTGSMVTGNYPSPTDWNIPFAKAFWPESRLKPHDWAESQDTTQYQHRQSLPRRFGMVHGEHVQFSQWPYEIGVTLKVENR